MATWVRLLLDPLLGTKFPFLTYLLAVLLAAWYGGLWPALVTLTLSAFMADYFILPPRGAISLVGVDQQTGMLLFLATGLGVALLGGAMKRAVGRAESNAAMMKQHAESISEAHRRFYQVVESAPNALVMVSADGRITMVNAQTETLFGYSRSELLGESVERLIPERWQAQHAVHRAHFADHPQTRPVGVGRDLFARHRDGSEFPVEIGLNPITTAMGIEILCSIVDISERKRSEDALRANELQLRLFVEQAPVSIAMFDTQMRYVVTSRRWIEDYGRGHDNLIGLSHYEVHPDLPERWKQIHRRGMAGEVQQADEDEWSLEDGSKRCMRWAVHPWVKTSGQIGGIIIFAEDITQRRHDQELMQRQQQQLALITNNVPGPLALLDGNGRYVFANKMFERWTSKTASEIIGRTPAEVLSPESMVRARPMLARAMKGEQVVHENEIRNASGEIYHAQVTLVPQLTTDGKLSSLVVIVADITELKRVEQALRETNEALERRVKERTAALEAANKELEAFSYSVSHDLRAPLRAIDGFSRIVLESYAAALPDEAREYLQDIRANTQQMGRLVDDLLAFARLSRQPLRRQPIDTLEIVHAVLQSLQAAQAIRTVELRIGELPPCHGDPNLLKQVWFNVLHNAMKYTAKRSPAIIEVGSRREADRTVYYVRDNGVGFDMRYVHKLFGVFQRLHRSEDYDGTGVGLAIVQRILDRHGGSIWAEAEPEQGAIFYFTIPDPEAPPHAESIG